MPTFLLELTPDWTMPVCATQCCACVAHNVAATFQQAAFVLLLSLMRFPCALERQTQLQLNDTPMLLGCQIRVHAHTYACCVCSFVRDCVHFSAYLLKLLITATQLRMRVCNQRSAEWPSCLSLNSSSSPCVLISLHSVLCPCLQKHDARKHTTHADKGPHRQRGAPLQEEMRPTVNFKWGWKRKRCWVINETNMHMAPLSFSLSLRVPR